MKKAKIFLTALTVLAVVGGALAFKAKQPKLLAQCDISLPTPKCVLNEIVTTQTTTASGGTIVDYDIKGNNCVKVNNVFTCTTRLVDEIGE